MKRIFTSFVFALSVMLAMAQGWPANWQGVMLQGFYWDSYSDTQWTNLESQADELSEFFKLVWVPQSGNCGSGNSMGYNDLWWFNDYNSSFGNEEQLRSMINTFKSKGIGTIADVVINHRSSMADTWMTFPVETYNGVTYTMTGADICSDDDSGKTAANAEITPTGAKDTGEDFDGARDLDHSSTNVQTIVKAYLDFLLNDLDYAGFRYDMTKGYAPEYTTLYNLYAQPEYSVGEYWDGDYSNLSKWVSSTASDDGTIQSAAFDFVLKYYIRDCCNAGTNWNKLGSSSLMSMPSYRRYAVTFVDNHDTYDRGNDSETTANILAANAFILAAPGTPCVFLPHWKSYKLDIKQMIYARNLAKIHNQSTYSAFNNSTSQYAIKVSGTDGNTVVIIMGDQGIPSGMTESDYHLVSKGDNYSYYISKDVESAWTDIPSGSYDNGFSVTLNALSKTDGVKIVYTTDGTEPSASNGTQVDDGTVINVNSDMTLKAGLLIGSTVSGIITRNYTVTAFEPHDITVYLKADWSPMYYHMWDSDGYTTTWPGTRITNTTVIDDIEWYYNSYTLKASDYCINLVFTQGSNGPQTVDINNITTDKFYELSDSKDGSGHYYVNDVTDQHSTGIGNIPVSNPSNLNGIKVFSIDGRLLRSYNGNADVNDALTGLGKGIYIVNDKKIVIK